MRENWKPITGVAKRGSVLSWKELVEHEHKNLDSCSVIQWFLLEIMKWYMAHINISVEESPWNGGYYKNKNKNDGACKLKEWCLQRAL